MPVILYIPIFQIQYVVEYAFVFMFGLFVGSFLNVLVYRLPIGKSPFWPTWSFCPNCRQTLAWYDNIPVISYLALGCKCRQCKVSISPRYAIVEILTGLLFLLVFAVTYIGQNVPWYIFGVYVIFTAALIVTVFTDLECFIIPDEISVWGTGAALVASLLMPALHKPLLETYTPGVFVALQGLFGSLTANLDGLAASFFGMCIGAGITLAVAWLGKLMFRRDAMGYGDVKLMALVGALLGAKAAVFTFFLAPFIGLPVGIITLVGRKEREIPYGPYLAIMAFIAMLWLEPVINKLAAMRDAIIDLIQTLVALLRACAL